MENVATERSDATETETAEPESGTHLSQSRHVDVDDVMDSVRSTMQCLDGAVLRLDDMLGDLAEGGAVDPDDFQPLVELIRSARVHLRTASLIVDLSQK